MRGLLVVLVLAVPVFAGCAESDFKEYPGPYPATGPCANIVTGDAAGHIVVNIPTPVPAEMNVRVDLEYAVGGGLVKREFSAGCHDFLTVEDRAYRIVAHATSSQGGCTQVWVSPVIQMEGAPVYVPAEADVWECAR